MTFASQDATGISLRAVLADSMTARPRDVRVSSCTADARQVKPGDAFVAVATDEQDGHDHVVEAVRRGAAAVVCERMLPVFNVPQFVVADTRSAYGKLCQALVGYPSTQLKVIGVTGTRGKTTVVRLLAAVLEQVGHRVGTIDSLSCCDGSDYLPMADVELSQTFLARQLGQMSAHGMTHAIVEVDSRGLSQSLLAGIQLDGVCITHVGRDHLDAHGSLENYRLAKRRILDYLQPHGVAVLNADCQTSMRMLAELNQPALTFGLKQPSEITAELIERHVNEQLFVLAAGDESAGVRTAMIGDHHLYNCLAATAMGLAYGIELPQIARGLEAVETLPGRMERVLCGQNYSVLVDAANSPESLQACLRAARTVTDGRLICVFGADGRTTREHRTALGRVAGALSDSAIVTVNSPRQRTNDDVTRDVVQGFADPSKAHVILGRTEAIAYALDQADEGDTVVLAGMGDRLYPNAAAGGLPGDDADVARFVLTGSAAPALRIAA